MAEGFDTKGVSTEEISEKELRFGYWFVAHREQLMKLGIGFLMAFSVATIGYSLYKTIRFYAFEYDAFQLGLQTAAVDYINIAGIHEANQIIDLQVESRQILPLGGGKIDIIARISNPNTKWALKSFNYRFAVGSNVYPVQTAYVLPGQERYLMLLNVEGPASGTPQLFIEEQRWQRVIQYQDWGPQRTNFTVANRQFTPARQGELSGQLPISEASAQITNATAYNYTEVEVQIALMSGNRVVAVNQVPLADFSSGQTRTVSARWSQVLPPVNLVEIIPTVNILEQSSYRNFEGRFDPSRLEIEPRF